MFMFNFLKNLIFKLKADTSQKKLLNSIKIGDLVWAKMPLSKKELKKIEESHRIRPYLVISKDSHNIWGYPSSSSSRQNKGFNNYEEYCIPKTRYNQNKSSWISFLKPYKIPVCNLVSKYRSLSIFDLRNIQKRLILCNSKNIDLILDNLFETGDIVSKNKKLFYIYSADNSFLYSFSIRKKSPKDNKKYIKIIVNHKTYYADFENLYSFKRIENIQIKDIAYRAEIGTIALQLKQFRYNKRKLCTAPAEKTHII
ncbi:MAG: hypothetical protein HFJ50_04815 [Clostridia bacterium]|jgi:hypothetical protein|nr:hypothetical protein [Clostridia bacterium]